MVSGKAATAQVVAVAGGVPTYRVTALKMGTLGADRSALLMLTDPGTSVEIPVWAAAIEGNGVRVIVDTGIRDPDWVVARMGPCRQESDETMTGALAAIGWRASEVDVVINTHLHYDHVGFNHLFPQARFIVGATEWDAAQDPPLTQRVLYEPREWLMEPLSIFNYEIVSGDYADVLPGIKLINTPGHSLGHQSVLVNTQEGVLCVVGDAVNIDENFTIPAPGGIHLSVADALASIEKVRSHADSVLMAHDGRISKYQTGGFPAVPPAAQAGS
jgi:glyoxylase-like metal-dependent hydrolase (beta-lactamase superfamily II)